MPVKKCRSQRWEIAENHHFLPSNAMKKSEKSIPNRGRIFKSKVVSFLAILRSWTRGGKKWYENRPKKYRGIWIIDFYVYAFEYFLMEYGRPVERVMGAGRLRHLAWENEVIGAWWDLLMWGMCLDIWEWECEGMGVGACV